MDTIAITALIIGVASWLTSLVLLLTGYEIAGYVSFGIGVIAFVIVWICCEIETMGDGKGDAWLQDD